MYPAAYDAGRSRKNHDEFTFQNWSDGGEIMHYAFLHMSEFFTQAIIYRSGPISGLTSNPDKDIASLTVETHLGEMTIDDYVEQGPVDGVVIVRSGEVVYERYPRMRPFDKHLLMSVSKIFVSTVIGILEDEGKVDSSAPIDRYLPELSGSGWEGVSVRDILDMASGIDCLESDEPGAYSDPSTAYYQYEASPAGLRRPPRRWNQPTHISRRSAAGVNRARPSNTRRRTRSLSWLAERVTGQLFNEIVTDMLWSRIGAESDALVSTSRVGAPASHGGISATVRDVARLGLLFTPSWNVVADESIISATHMRRIQEEGRPGIFDSRGRPVNDRVVARRATALQ
ncbi:MAG: serine hydrolase domain-containing protein [Thermomicrobiales bacterium]